MAEESKSLVRQVLLNRWVLYFAKAILALGVIYLMSRVLPSMPSIAVGVCWAILSAVVSIGLVYPYIVRKLLKRHEYEPGGHLARLNDGRFVRLTIAFVASAVLVAALLFEIVRWSEREWLVAALAIPVFLAFYLLFKKLLSKEVYERYRSARAIRWSRVATAVLLCLAYAALLSTIPAESYENATEAFLATPNIFEASASTLLSEGGKLLAFMEATCAYAIAKAAQASFTAYLVCKVVLVAAAFYSISAIVGLCALTLDEIRQEFASVEPAGEGEKSPLIKRYVVFMLVLPVVFAGAFAAVDAKAADVAKSEEYTAVDQFIRNRIGLTVCIIDGKAYDYEAVQDFLEQLDSDAESLGEEAAAELVPLINEAFDKRVENVDKYLDWYYSLSADYSSLGHLLNGTVEEFMQEQLETYLNEGVDDTLLKERIVYYTQRAEALEAAAQDELVAYEVNVPEWLIQEEVDVDTSAFDVTYDMDQKLKAAGVRLGAAGLTATILNHVVGKKVFSTMSKKLATKLGVKAGEKVASTLLVPIPGLGIVAKIAVDAVTTVAVDKLLIMADEKANRDEYHQELVDAINEQRAEMLALFE